MRVLAADIGGTKTLFQIIEWAARREDRHVLVEHRYHSNDYLSFDTLLQEFLSEVGSKITKDLVSACFAVAGPVVNGVAKATNLPWQLDPEALKIKFKIPQVILINDFQAQGYGIECLCPDDFAVLQQGDPELKAPQTLIGAGTGLGQALLVWHELLGHYQVLATEGGHVDFAPSGPLQIKLLEYLSQSLTRVSYERLLSGSGLVNIYRFLKEQNPTAENPTLKDAMREGDPAAAISRFAMEYEDFLAHKSLELFAQIYGAQAGNLALTCISQGGVFVGGGIAPKILKYLQAGGFMKAFLNKGRLSVLLEHIPVKVILEPKVGLWGASLVAARYTDGKM
ncbi:glucokinase [Candidatus Nitrosacidococcus sp. I8]|uniref:glucokinase n=1 Tax=Candidatus Nitrosacidococcus sp. I8 TaxID=2942908 RepID=UPI002226CB44|nr:glucokinase [Candidatus Nitrosacidococcus sp. I8]CAH9018492.1 Glucokinase [Candidatus Nitrosacidococcus sp. I8]